MSKYITDFQQIGNSTINVDLVCKDWNDRFSICTWINDDEEKYTFIVNGKRKNKRLGEEMELALQKLIRVSNVAKIFVSRAKNVKPFFCQTLCCTLLFVQQDEDTMSKIFFNN